MLLVTLVKHLYVNWFAWAYEKNWTYYYVGLASFDVAEMAAAVGPDEVARVDT